MNESIVNKTLSFIENSKKIHGNDKFDYSKTQYKNSTEKIIIICKLHGEFKQAPSNHLAGNNCPKCSRIKQSERQKLTKTDFINKSNLIHNLKYDYSNFIYEKSDVKGIIICKVHGEFKQSPNTHLMGHGCSKCVGIKKLTTNEFIEIATKIHNNKYCYDKVNYKNSKEKVIIICKLHGEFKQTPNNHTQGQECPICVKLQQSEEQTLSTEQFIVKANLVHNNTYCYDRTLYLHTDIKVKIKCNVLGHGYFEQTPHNHLKGNRCPKCFGNEKSNTEEFINRANEIHSHKYNYDKVQYLTNHTKVKIKCKIPGHGYFEQTPSEHINQKSGCPKCASNSTIGFLNKKLINSSHTKATIYLLKFKNDIEEFYKFGITTNLKIRIRKMKYQVQNNYNIEVVMTEDKEINIACNIEKNLINYFVNCKYIPKIKFHGYTECFDHRVNDFFKTQNECKR